MSHPCRSRHLIATVLVAASVACGRAERSAVPPTTEFLVAAGDSTFWVRTGANGVRVRRAPLVLARVDGRFYELYVSDDDRSFYDATFVGQRVYRRDLLTNDSLAVFDDPIVPTLATEYARRHPGQHPLDSDEEGSDSPHTVVTSEAEVVEVLGPFVTIEHHTDVDIDQGDDRHLTRRGVVDLRRGERATLASIFGDTAALQLTNAGRRSYLDALDSVRRGGEQGGDERARRAADAIDAFAFDSSSFSITAHGGTPAVSFLAPGTGERAGGLTLALPPVPVPRSGWWRDASESLPTHIDSIGDEWHGRHYDVLVRADTSADDGVERLTLVVRDSTKREWPLGPLPSPAHRLWRLDELKTDTAARRALDRAFDESVLYDEEARTASAPRIGMRLVRMRVGGPPHREFVTAAAARRHRDPALIIRSPRHRAHLIPRARLHLRAERHPT